MSPALTRRASNQAALLSCVFLLVSALFAPHLSAASATQEASAASSGDARAIFRLLNHERVKRGLRPLRHSDGLDEAARWQSRDMVARGYFEHQRPGGPSLSERIRRTGYLTGARNWAVGENIAWGEGSLSTPESIMRAWMNSPGHRANILRRRFEHVGIGLASGTPEQSNKEGAVTATTDFGARD
jgi:uncharacterized protein YkwD